MSQRPRRSTAVQSLKLKQNKEKDESDELGLSEASSDEGDFSSGSSDDWDPVKSKNNETREEDETFEDSEEDISGEECATNEEESFFDSPVKKKSKGNRSIVASLKGSAVNKFKRNQKNRANLSSNLQEILQRAQFQKKKFISSRSNNETHDHQSKEKTPDFDCSGGMQLSDSSDDSDDEKQKPSDVTGNNKSLINSINEVSSNTMDLRVIHENLKQMERDKAKLLSYSKIKPAAGASSSQKENYNVSDLLALGEGAGPSEGNPKITKKRSRQAAAVNASDDSDGGWEEVEDEEKGYQVPKDGVEITLNNCDQDRRKQVKKADIEAQMKRKFNRARKENQMILHKANLICWIAHGNFVNQRLNDTKLMESALKLLPKNDNHCYPKDKTDLDYFQQITKWFKSTVALKNKEMYCQLKTRPPLMLSLALQMKFKAAICRRDFILIFIVLLRAIGIQCRMVQSLECAPLMPPKSELISVPTKKPEESAKVNLNKSKSSGSTKSASNKSTSNLSKTRKSSSKSFDKKTSHISPNKKSPNKSPEKSSHKSPEKSSRSSRLRSKKEAPKIPQLDGGDDGITTRRRAAKTKAPESGIDDEILNPKKKKMETTKLTPKLKVSLDSPNGNHKSPSDKLFKSKTSVQTSVRASKSVTENEKLQIFSPRKTRSYSRDKPSKQLPAIETLNKSLKVKAESNSKKLKMNTLEVFSPRRTRSRSKSEQRDHLEVSREESKRPNLKALAAASSRKRPSTSKNVDLKINIQKPTKQLENRNELDSDGSMKLFKVAPVKSVKKSIDRRVLSSDSEVDVKTDATSPSKKKSGIDIWVEVYSEKDERWISIDVFKNKVDCIKEICKTTTHPMIYVFAWNQDSSIKDVSARYCQNLNTTVRKQRVECNYLASILNQFTVPRTARDRKEDDELSSLQMTKPMPTSIAEFKNHPLYALKRHLLKFQAIYPADAPTVGFIRDEPIYPRDCVFTLHSRETWLKEARVVKLHETAYKVVTTIRWDKVNNKLMHNIPLDIFGIWQTEDYIPPSAENGVVPRNAYGNVELFKACMIPKGTVHLQLPGLNRTCKKLGVDCAQAIVGFDSHGGFSHPVYDGYIICEEFTVKVIDAWTRDQEEQERKDREKIEKRVYDNWKKLIKGLFIRERLKTKYNFHGKEH